MIFLRRHALTLALVAALALAGCGDDDKTEKQAPAGAGDGFASDDLKRFVLTDADLPSGYDSQERKTSSSADACLTVSGNKAAENELKRDFTSLGFEGCAGASFKKQTSGSVRKNNRPAGLAVLMRDEDSAAKAVPSLRKALLNSFTSSGTAGTFKPHSLAAPGLGDEAPRGLSFSGNLGPLPGKATFYVYVWRRGNVVAWVGSSDVLGDFDADSTLELARRIDARGSS
jgi:hypothetical protein